MKFLGIPFKNSEICRNPLWNLNCDEEILYSSPCWLQWSFQVQRSVARCTYAFRIRKGETQKDGTFCHHLAIALAEIHYFLGSTCPDCWSRSVETPHAPVKQIFASGNSLRRLSVIVFSTINHRSRFMSLLDCFYMYNEECQGCLIIMYSMVLKHFQNRTSDLRRNIHVYLCNLKIWTTCTLCIQKPISKTSR